MNIPLQGLEALLSRNYSEIQSNDKEILVHHIQTFLSKNESLVGYSLNFTKEITKVGKNLVEELSPKEVERLYNYHIEGAAKVKTAETTFEINCKSHLLSHSGDLALKIAKSKSGVEKIEWLERSYSNQIEASQILGETDPLYSAFTMYAANKAAFLLYEMKKDQTLLETIFEHGVASAEVLDEHNQYLALDSYRFAAFAANKLFQSSTEEFWLEAEFTSYQIIFDLAGKLLNNRERNETLEKVTKDIKKSFSKTRNQNVITKCLELYDQLISNNQEEKSFCSLIEEQKATVLEKAYNIEKKPEHRQMYIEAMFNAAKHSQKVKRSYSLYNKLIDSIEKREIESEEIIWYESHLGLIGLEIDQNQQIHLLKDMYKKLMKKKGKDESFQIIVYQVQNELAQKISDHKKACDLISESITLSQEMYKETDQKHWLEKCYDSVMMQAEILQNKRKKICHYRMAQKTARKLQGGPDKQKWVLNSYLATDSLTKLLYETGNRSAGEQFRILGRIALDMHEYTQDHEWLVKAHTAFLKSARAYYSGNEKHKLKSIKCAQYVSMKLDEMTGAKRWKKATKKAQEMYRKEMNRLNRFT